MKPLHITDWANATPCLSHEGDTSLDGRGRRTPATLLALDERDRYLVEASKHFPGLSQRERFEAPDMNSRDERYTTRAFTTHRPRPPIRAHLASHYAFCVDCFRDWNQVANSPSSLRLKGSACSRSQSKVALHSTNVCRFSTIGLNCKQAT